MLLTTAAIAVMAAGVPAAAQTPCWDRKCLAGVMSVFLDAVVAHDPTAAPLAAKVRFTEDTATLAVGEGIWKTATKRRPYRVDFLDVAQGVAAVHTVLEESGTPVLFAARLKVLSEYVEHHVDEEEGTIFSKARKAGLDLEVLGAQFAERKSELEAGQPPVDMTLLARSSRAAPRRNGQRAMR